MNNRNVGKTIQYPLVAIFFCAALISCNSSGNEKRTDIKPAADRSKLTEEQKRMPENALSAFTVADGLQVELFASEPRMLNPTNMDIDHRGRVWITEGYNYRFNLNAGHPHKDEGDRILILEDTDGNGKADTSKVFYQDSTINAALGIAVLGNRVIVSCSPNVFVLTDENGDDKADKKEILFQGIGGVQHDHAIHAFTFGPDGKLYFNFGNAGDSILDRNGTIIKDIEGTPVNARGKPYRQGMVFRCDMDGSNFEVLGNNFRNNYEVAVDAFGNLWQSDNDDDGNRGVRINYVMEYGNYGYTDEMTGAGWQSRRTNMEDSIPFRHWHLNDPGVVPNLLQTGSGSPTGMVVYEGSLLPEKYRGQMIHSEPGHNVVRSYPVTKDGAGYKAEIVNVLESKEDDWFRPSDICIAPDGSLFIADWYDPGVGGHQVGDLDRGRIFRVAPDVSRYKIPAFSTSSVSRQIEALENPNLATRYLAWQKLHEQGAAVEKDLAKVFNDSDNPRFRARAFWLLSKIPGKGTAYVQQALQDKNEDIRIAALKAARQLKLDIIPIVKQMMNGSSAHINRELLTAIRHNPSPEAASVWATLAQKYDGKDRWYLEALGISADKQWDGYFEAWLNKVESNWNTPAGRDIVWRARAKKSLPLLAAIIQDPATEPSANLRYFRAFDFYADTSKQRVLLSLLEGNHPAQNLITVYALTQLDTSKLAMTASLKSSIDKSLEVMKGRQEFLDIVGKYKIRNQNPEILNIALNSDRKESRANALKLLVANNGEKELNAAIHKDTASAMILIGSMGEDSRNTKDLLQALVRDKSLDLQVRRKATQMLSSGWNGQQRLLTLVMENKLPPDLDTMAERILMRAWRQDIKKKVMAYYNKGNTTESLAPVTQLVSLTGNPGNGKAVFNSTCASCHQVNNSGTNFGPDLSEIGAKYQKDGLYKSILQPDDGIAFGYEGYTVSTKDGNQMLGVITSETKDELAVKVMGGQVNRVKKSDLVSKKPYRQSLMPEGLVSGLKQQQVVDLVEYLAELKKKK